MYITPADVLKGQKKVLDNTMEIKLQDIEQPDMCARNQTWISEKVASSFNC